MDTNSATRCLPRLCQLTSSQLLVSLWPVVPRIARLVHQFTPQTASPQELFEFETKLQQLLCEMGRRMVQWKLNLLAHGDMEFGITRFDELQRSQKLVALYKSSCALLHPDKPTLKLTAYVESAVAIVYDHAKEPVPLKAFCKSAAVWCPAVTAEDAPDPEFALACPAAAN